MKKLVFTCLLICVLSVSLFAQKAPVKYGKVSREELAQSSFPGDSTIDAAVLCEYGVFDSNELQFTHTIRYKIYSKEGLNSLIMTIPVTTKEAVKGMVYNMEDGEIVKSRMTRESIYKERVIGRYSRMRIAPPDAKAGSVIDIRFTYPGLPYEWQFQKRIPVLWSELRIPDNQYIRFNKRFIGYEPLDVNSPGRWVGKNMPPFLAEPYINSGDNYMTTMFVEISEINVPGDGASAGISRDYSTTWDAVCDYFLDDQYYGGILRDPCLYLKDAAEEVKSISSTEEELVINALERIRKDVKWNKTEDLYPSETMRDVFVNEKTGTSTDMNFFFLKLLKKLDIECYPMVMSTRSEGTINPLFPSRSRFNYTVSYVKIGDRFHVIDAADKYFGFDMLNRSCLNGSGFVLRKNNPEWVTLSPEKSLSKMANCVLTISEDGFVEGSIQRQHADYASASFRKRYEKYTTEDEYLEDFEQSHPGIFVMDYSIKNIESNLGKILEAFQVEIDGIANVSGGMIYLDPQVIDRIEENPFKLESREYPVDFAYGRSSMYILTLNIPEGYVAEQLPKPIRLVNTDKSALFTYSVTQNGNVIQLMSKMTIKKPVFLQNEYEELRDFYSIIVNKEAEPIILKRANP